MDIETRKALANLNEQVRLVSDAVNSLTKEYKNFSEKTEKKVLEKAEATHLEKDLLNVVNLNLKQTFVTVLQSYNSPVNKLLTKVVNDNEDQILVALNLILNSALESLKKNSSISEQFEKILIRSIISIFQKETNGIENILNNNRELKSEIFLSIRTILNNYKNSNNEKELYKD